MPSVYNGISTNSDAAWWRDPGLRRNVFWITITAITHVVSGYDASLFGSLLAVPMFFKTFPRLAVDSSLLGVTGALLFLPGLVVPFFSAWLTDKVGRKVPIITGTIGIIVATVIQATAPRENLVQFMVGRFMLGAFTSLSGLAGLALCAELCHPRFRAQGTSMQVAVYYLGSILCAWTTYGSVLHHPESSWSWRIPVLLQAAIPAVILPFLFVIPQSPRWLISKGRIDEARIIFATQHANGAINDPLVDIEVEEVVSALALEQDRTSWRALFSTKGNRWRMFIVINTACGAQLNGSGIISYWLVPVLKTLGITSYLSQCQISGGLSISNFFFATAASIAIERVGRRPLWLLSTGIMLVCLIAITALSAEYFKTHSSALAGTTVAFLYLFYAGYDLAWSPLNSAYTVEVLTYHMRAKGLALWTFATYVSLSFNTWVNPIALAHMGWKYYIVYIGVLCYLFAVVCFAYPETRGRTLEEVAQVFDQETLQLPTVHPQTLDYTQSKGESEDVVKVSEKAGISGAEL